MFSGVVFRGEVFIAAVFRGVVCSGAVFSGAGFRVAVFRTSGQFSVLCTKFGQCSGSSALPFPAPSRPSPDLP